MRPAGFSSVSYLNHTWKFSHLFHEFIIFNWAKKTVAVSVSLHLHYFNRKERMDHQKREKIALRRSELPRKSAAKHIWGCEHICRLGLATQRASQRAAVRAAQRKSNISSISQARNLRPCNGTIADWWDALSRKVWLHTSKYKLHEKISSSKI